MEFHDSGISLSPSYRQLNNEYRFEHKRLQTFRNWPVEAPIESVRVAKAGFYYTGSGQECQCFACNGKIQVWSYGDQAMARHRQMNPSCPFILNRSSNVPLNSEAESIMLANQCPQTSPSPSALPVSSLSHSQTFPAASSPRISQDDSLTEGYGSDSSSPQITSPVLPSVSNESSILAGDEPGPSLGYHSLQTEPDAVPRPSLVNQHSAVHHTLSNEEWVILRREDVRLRTFDHNFSATFLYPSTLAAVGFFYLGVADHVQCVYCRGVIADWEVTDDPRAEHLRLFPNCPFILGLPVGNVSLGQSSPPVRTLLEQAGTLPSLPAQGFDVTPRFPPRIRSGAGPDTPVHTFDLSTPSSSTSSGSPAVNGLIGEHMEELGISKHRGPRYPAYATAESRLKTFVQWPTHLKQTPALMSAAGFFYLGLSDHVKCFHCDGGLRNWEPHDEPWLEHARWFPHCRFVELMKGQPFIKEAAASLATTSRPSRSHPPLPLVSSPRSAPRDVSEEELRSLLDSPIAQTVLNMGVDLSRVKQAIRYKMRATGHPFRTVDSLLEAAIEVQHYSDYRQAMEDRNYETVEWSSAPTPEPSGGSQERRESMRIESLDTSESSSDETAAHPPDPERVSPQPEDSTAEESPMEQEEEDSDRAEGDAAPAESMEDAARESIPADADPKAGAADHCASSALDDRFSETDRTHMLEEEVRRLREARLCKVCLDEEVSIAYIPCGHIVTCVQCAAALQDCPLCRKIIKGTVRIFFS